MEIKVQCVCGQKYKFDVEPVNGGMPHGVNCPVCGADGTAAGNAAIAQLAPAAPRAVAVPVAAAPASGLQLNRATHAPEPGAAPVAYVPPLPSAPRLASAPKTASGHNMGMGILGAFIGALVGVGLVYAFYEWAGFRFPLLGIAIGALTGLGAKIFYRGSDETLGYISGGLALVSVVASLYLMYGEFPFISIISVAVSVSVAYRIAS
jgi:hypothetical protein